MTTHNRKPRQTGGYLTGLGYYCNAVSGVSEEITINSSTRQIEIS